MVKLGFTGEYIIFLFLLQNIHCGYSLEPPQLTCTQIYVLSKNKKNITFFQLKITIFTAVKYCSILHGHVCVMFSTFTIFNLYKGCCIVIN